MSVRQSDRQDPVSVRQSDRLDSVSVTQSDRQESVSVRQTDRLLRNVRECLIQTRSQEEPDTDKT